MIYSTPTVHHEKFKTMKKHNGGWVKDRVLQDTTYKYALFTKFSYNLVFRMDRGGQGWITIDWSLSKGILPVHTIYKP